MKTTEMTITNGADQFYPTPPSVAEKMLDGIDWRMVKTILEPSAGKGDLIWAAARAKRKQCGRYYDHTLDVDAVEIDPYLREICKYNFSKQKAKEYWEPHSKLRDISYHDRTQAQEAEMNRLADEARLIESVDLHIVHDDFLTYKTYKEYDLILMNPPFADGDLHLLKALEMQKDGGNIVCLLNAETIRNPYNERRRLLLQKIREYDAEIEYLEDAFSTDAERKASVDVAIVKVRIPFEMKESPLFERMKKAAEEEYVQDPEISAVVPSDSIDQAICLYNAEVAATMALIEEYRRLAPYISREFGEKGSPIISLVVEHDSTYGGLDVQKYMRSVRLKYWRALFRNDEFTGRLTSNLLEQYRKDVEKMADYEFSAFNIKQVLVEMNASIHKGIQDTIMELFEKLTVEHSYYPECSKNKHYYSGWKTNQAHKISKKSIIPSYGIFGGYSWSKKTFDWHEAYRVLSDIEKAFDYLDGGRFEGSRLGLESFLKCADERGQTRNIECTYFLVDLYKKGTVHIKFRPEAMPLVERLNIYAAKGKAWLPPSYGNAAYSNLDAEEKAVVDSFHGDGSEGSGQTAYAEILKDRSYYLSAPSQNMPLLNAGE